MTLLSIAEEILRETKSAVIPTSIIGNSQDAAKQVLEALNIAIINVSRANDWEELQDQHTFNSVASTEGYDLPADFDSIIDNTFWNTTRLRTVIGPTTPQDWRILNNSTITGATANDYFRIRKGQTLIFPIPTAIEGYIYEYMTDLRVNSSVGVGQTGWEADTDVPNIDEYLVRLYATWRFLKMQGKPYAEELLQSNLALTERISKNGGNKTIFHSDNRGIDKSRIGYPTLITAP